MQIQSSLGTYVINPNNQSCQVAGCGFRIGFWLEHVRLNLSSIRIAGVPALLRVVEGYVETEVGT